MDEPFGALDPLTRDGVGSAYRGLHDRLGLTTIMVTHDMQEAILLSDRIAVMKTGGILAHDTPRALMAGPTHPEVAALLDLPRRRVERIRALSDEAAAGQSDE
jgi:osmoprotectant transport system ATP-binding protein